MADEISGEVDGTMDLDTEIAMDSDVEFLDDDILEISEVDNNVIGETSDTIENIFDDENEYYQATLNSERIVILEDGTQDSWSNAQDRLEHYGTTEMIDPYQAKVNESIENSNNLEKMEEAIDEPNEEFLDISNEFDIETIKMEAFEEMTTEMDKDSLVRLRDELQSYENESRALMEMDDDEGGYQRVRK